MSTVRTLARLLLPEAVRDGVRFYIDSDFRDRRCIEHDVTMGRIVFEHVGPIVQDGPFKGMRYAHGNAAFTLGPKLLGTYEIELNDVIERLIAEDFRSIVNVGSGEGYYAVGLAMRIARASVIAFEGDKRKREQFRALADLNGVPDRIDLRGFAAPHDLTDALTAEHALLICDVEGGETELLDPATVPALRRTTILAEMHDILRKGLSSEIHARFQATHDITVIPTRRRRKADWPRTVPPHRKWSACLSESRRGAMTWSYMRPR